MQHDRLCPILHCSNTVKGHELYSNVDFEEIVCYSQTVILALLAIGYIVNFMKEDKTIKKKVETKCPSCDFKIQDKNVQYCAKCGNMLSHSDGLSLEK